MESNRFNGGSECYLGSLVLHQFSIERMKRSPGNAVEGEKKETTRMNREAASEKKLGIGRGSLRTDVRKSDSAGGTEAQFSRSLSLSPSHFQMCGAEKFLTPVRELEKQKS